MVGRIASSPVLLSLLLCATSASSTPSAANTSCSLNSYTIVPDNGTGIWPYREYKSSNITPPVFNITQSGEALAPGYVFLTVTNAGQTLGEHQERPVIVDNTGDLIWAGPNTSTNNLRTQTLHGQKVISYWRGSGDAAASTQAGHGFGQVEIFDAKYQKLYTVCPKVQIRLPPGVNSSCVADVHESYITPDNTILVTVYNTTPADLTSVGGPKNGWLLNPLAVEVDIETNEALWIWDPLAHLPIVTSHAPIGKTGTNSSNPYDWFHMNSIQLFEGKYLVNGRHTWAAYYVNRNGSVEWTIDGVSGGDFGSLPDTAKFSWQHHARLHNVAHPKQKLITFFADNNASPRQQSSSPSLGLGLLLDFPPSKNNTPQIWSRLVDARDPVAAWAEGSYQLITDNQKSLASSNSLLGYGIKPVVKEFGPDPKLDGDVRWSAQFGYANSGQSYRAFKEGWHATPPAPIALVVAKAGVQDGLQACAAGAEWRGFVSWNGATDVQRYTVYAGSSEYNLRRVAIVEKQGFETEFVVPLGAKIVQVKVDEGKILRGQSAVVAVGSA